LDLWHNISGCGNGRNPVDPLDFEPPHDGPEAGLSTPKRRSAKEIIEVSGKKTETSDYNDYERITPIRKRAKIGKNLRNLFWKSL
jgi:hypothetical protein